MEIKSKKNLILLNLLLLLALISSTYSISIIPDEIGFGMNTIAGRGGEIYIIDNLNDSGKNSLRECFEANGPRICLFEISGTIELENHLYIKNPNIIVAGQTAPSPGISLKNGGIIIQASDVLIQHIRIRVGDEEMGPNYDDRDAIKIEAKYADIENIIIDHVSASWAIDEIFSTWSDKYMVKNVTVINSIFSEALYDSFHSKGGHSMGTLIGKNTENLLYSKNILAFNNYRNPLIRDDSTNIIIANNYIFNPGIGSKSKIYFGTTGTKNLPMYASVVGNIFKANPQEYYYNLLYVEKGSASDFNLYIDDNKGPMDFEDQWESVYGINDMSIRENSLPINIEGLNYLKSADVEEHLLENSGARPYDRDEVDKRIIFDIENFQLGTIINSQEEVGSWPKLDINKRKLNIPKNPHEFVEGKTYTNLELFIHQYSLLVEKNIPISDYDQENETPIIELDISAPIISGKEKIILPSGTKSTQLIIETDEIAYCHYDDEANEDYLEMSYLFDNKLTKTHFATIDNLEDGKEYTYYIRCRDISNPRNYNDEDFIVSIIVESPVIIKKEKRKIIPQKIESNKNTSLNIDFYKKNNSKFKTNLL